MNMQACFAILKSIFLYSTLQVPEQGMFTAIGVQQCSHIKQAVGSNYGSVRLSAHLIVTHIQWRWLQFAACSLH
jgi:hypothetical protein